MNIPNELREGAIALARDAAAAILGIYDSAFAVEHKADASPLTAADLAAHRILVEGLERLTPDILDELPDYSVDELTTRSIVVLLRKAAHADRPSVSASKGNACA